MQRRYPKGRAARGRTVGKIVMAYETIGDERLSLKDLIRITSVSRRAISETLKEMIEHGGIIKIVNAGWPPSTYYMFVELLADKKISEVEERYETLYNNSLSLMSPIKFVEHHALREGLQYVRERIEKANIGRFRPFSARTLHALKKSYFKLLNQALDDLRGVADESYRDDSPEKWEKCSNCFYCKKIQRMGTWICVCTREWRAGKRPEYDMEHLCGYFTMKMPKN